MHLIRVKIYAFLIVGLEILNIAFCVENGKSAPVITFQNVPKISNIPDSKLSEGTVKERGLESHDLPVTEHINNVEDKAVSNHDVTQKPKSVKKELKVPTEINVTKSEIPETQQTSVLTNIQNGTNVINATDIPHLNIPGEIHNENMTGDGKNRTASAVEGKAPLKPGAKKRGLIVFGTLGLLSISYFAFKIYRKRKQSRENNTSFYQNDNTQFKYGVLLSNENDDNLEMSNLPLTVDSEDEEMEIFDIEQKKYLDNNRRDTYRLESDSLTKDDIEILDLDLPGTSDTLSLRTPADDNLLNFDDGHLHDVSVIHHNVTSNGLKPTKSNDFYNVL